MKWFGVALSAFTLTSVAALVSTNAADMYRAPTPVAGGYKDEPVVQSWAGFYAGVNGGYGWSNAQRQLRDDPNFAGLSDINGGFGGGQIGYNWQGFGLSPLVLGIEADFQGSGIGEKRIAGGVSYQSDLDWFGTVRGRLGYSFGSSLLYGTGGLAYGHVINDRDNPAGVHYRFDDTATGYVVGGGLEHQFSPAWSLKLEYQFINLGKNDPISIVPAGVKFSSFSTTTVEDDAFHTVRVGVNYHFGSGYIPLK